MSDEIPPAPSETADDASKAETIRITLPAKPDQPMAKRETVRISLPGKPAPTPPPGVSPKKETTKISAESDAPAPAAGRPFVPPPPKPPGSLGATPLKPMSGINPPPKPPSLGAKPTMPLKPAPAPTTVAKPATPASGITDPVVQRAAAPKKETARITLPAEGGKAMPKATIKMQQTQPLVKQAAVTQSSLQPAPTISTSPMSQSEPVSDGTVNILSIVALVVALVAAALAFVSYSASALS